MNCKRLNTRVNAEEIDPSAFVPVTWKTVVVAAPLYVPEITPLVALNERPELGAGVILYETNSVSPVRRMGMIGKPTKTLWVVNPGVMRVGTEMTTHNRKETGRTS